MAVPLTGLMKSAPVRPAWLPMVPPLANTRVGESEWIDDPVEAEFIVVLLGDFDELGGDLDLLRLAAGCGLHQLLDLVEFRRSVA